MKKTVVTMLAVAGLISTSWGGAFAAPYATAKTAEQAVTGYFDAEKKGNITLMKQLAQDESFVDEEAQTEAYRETYETNPLIDYKIVSQDPIDEEHITFMVQRTHKTDTLPPLPVTAFKKNGSWKLLIQPIDINMIQGSPDYGTAKIVTTKRKKSGTAQKPAISPEVDVVYWNFSDLQRNTTILGSNSFGQFRSDGQFTINGWQQAAAGPASMLYEVVATFSSTVKVYSSQSVGSNYPKSGTWFNYYMTGVPLASGTPYRMRFTNTGYYNTSAGGNGYE